MAARYGSGPYGADVYAYGTTDLAGVLEPAVSLLGNAEVIRTIAGALSYSISLTGDLVKAGVQDIAGILTLSLMLQADMVKAVELAGVLETNTILRGRLSGDFLLYGEPLEVDFGLRGDMFAGPMWQDEDAASDPWVDEFPEDQHWEATTSSSPWVGVNPDPEIWTPINKPSSPWRDLNG